MISALAEIHLPVFFAVSVMLLKLPVRVRCFLEVEVPVALLALLAFDSVRLRPLKLQPLDEPGRCGWTGTDVVEELALGARGRAGRGVDGALGVDEIADGAPGRGGSGLC